MKLKITQRAANRKSDAKKMRREGKIPAVVYSNGKQGKNVVVSAAEYHALVREVPQGRLSTTTVILVNEDGKEQRAIIKDIQYKVTSYEVIHLDFEELHDDVPINVRVPIECANAMDCVGVKLGGVVRQVIRKIKVRGLPREIPHVFNLDIKELNMGDVKRLRDITIPETLRPIANLDEVAVVIVKR